MASVSVITLSQRKKMNVRKFIETYTEILEKSSGSDDVAVPCLRSKLDAAVEHVLFNKIAANNKYELVDEEGWPVRRRYVLSEKRYTIAYSEFATEILADDESLFLHCQFDDFHYKVFEFDKSEVPFFDFDFESNVKRVNELYQKLFSKYFNKIKFGSKQPGLWKFETDFIKTVIPTPQQLKDIAKTDKNLIYAKLCEDHQFREESSPLLKCYQTVLLMLKYLTYDVVDESTVGNTTSQVEETERASYKGELISITDGHTTFVISFAEGIGACFFIVRNSDYEYINAYRISHWMIPSFKSDNCFIFADNLRLEALNIFIQEILLKMALAVGRGIPQQVNLVLRKHWNSEVDINRRFDGVVRK